jgi:predicted ATPase/DNA-binding CsgD family transcriptional regulator
MRRTDSASGGNVPVELTGFVGRRHELGEVGRLLDSSRLVTLTGVGGVGKTRLAGRVAGGLRRAFRDGIWFVDLTALRAPEPLVGEVSGPEVLAYLVMGALGLRDQPRAGTAVEQLVRHLTGRRALLVLDNCEHLLPVSAILADTLLRGCHWLRILATSRQPLLLAEEVLFAVPPLPLPEPGADLAGVERFESVALFAARAGAAVPDFALTEDNAAVVAELCRRLDGLPLAIELAAARIRVLAPGQILERLTQRFALLSRGSRVAPQRQQTLRGSVEWSYELCAEPERLLWARLSVFVGGFEPEAVEGVCADAKLPAAELLDAVAGLIDKSIVVRDDTDGATARYRMLETLRDYGHEKLHSSGEHDRLRRRHRDWYTDLARRFETDMISPRQVDWIARLDRELPNLRAALQYSQADPDGAEAALVATAGLYRYWVARGLHREGRFWLEQALGRPGGPSMTRVKASFAHTVLASHQGDLTAASTSARYTRAVATDVGEPRAHAIAAIAEGSVARARGDLADAVRGYQRGLAGFAGEPAPGDLRWRLSALSGVALTKTMLGDVCGATACHEEILAICEPRGEYLSAGLSLCFLGIVLWKQGDLDAATAREEEALRRLRRVNNTITTSWCLDVLAWIAVDQGRLDRAATLLGAVERVTRSVGIRAGLVPDLTTNHEQYQRRTRAALGAQAYRAAAAHGGQMSLEQAVDYALDEPRQPAAPKPVAAPGATSTPLTRREQQVAELVAQGLSNKEIAAKLVISQRTAESHVEHILTKLGCTNRAQAAARMVARDSPATRNHETAG